MKDIQYSIITPVFNRADCIIRCMDSVSSQLVSNVGYEHIIVDDGSIDETYSIVIEYALQHPHVHHFQFDKNKGTNAARNKAISMAKGNYCILLDSDDYFTKDAIATIERVRLGNPGYSHFLFTPSDRGEEVFKYVDSNQYQREFLYEDFLSGVVFGDFIHVIKTDNLLKHPFYEAVRIQEYLTLMKIYREEKKLLFANYIVTIRERMRHDSVTKESLRVNDKHIQLNKEGIEFFLNNFKRDLVENNLYNLLSQKYSRLLENMLLLSQYKEAEEVMNTMNIENIHVPLTLKMTYQLRIGWLYKLMLKYYLKWKYRHW